jgi:hypothetical protein
MPEMSTDVIPEREVREIGEDVGELIEGSQSFPLSSRPRSPAILVQEARHEPPFLNECISPEPNRVLSEQQGEPCATLSQIYSLQSYIEIPTPVVGTISTSLLVPSSISEPLEKAKKEKRTKRRKLKDEIDVIFGF